MALSKESILTRKGNRIRAWGQAWGQHFDAQIDFSSTNKAFNRVLDSPRPTISLSVDIHTRTHGSVGVAENIVKTSTSEHNESIHRPTALQLAPLVFVRPGELRKAEWTEIDLDACEWRIPAERMKMRARHLVPLSTKQAVEILKELKRLTGSSASYFPASGPTDDR